MKIARPYLLAVAASAAMLLSGCGASGGVAARVDGTTINTADVDLMTSVSCRLYQGYVKANPGRAATQVPMKLVAYDALNTLVATQVLQNLNASHHATAYDANLYRQQMQKIEQEASAAPAKDRARYLELEQAYTKATLVFQRVAERSLGSEGIANAPAEEKQKAAQKLYLDFRKSQDIKINPAYSPDQDQNIGSGESSMSRPVSHFAKAIAKDSPDPATVAELPANQRCG